METKIESLRGSIEEKAIKDNDFRMKLIENPREAIENEFGIQLPADLTISVFERGPNDFHFSLPPQGKS